MDIFFQIFMSKKNWSAVLKNNVLWAVNIICINELQISRNLCFNILTKTHASEETRIRNSWVTKLDQFHVKYISMLFLAKHESGLSLLFSFN